MKFPACVLGVLGLLLAPYALSQAPKSEPASAQVDERIGTWDGKTQTAELEGPYEDPLQQAIPFGKRSYYLSPWRAYMDTWPASRFLQCLGINFNIHKAEELDPVAAVLAEAGIRSARVEIGWSSFSYDDPNGLPGGTVKRITAAFQALKKHNVRPLVLLNANSGAPCALKVHSVKLLKDAPAGAREIFVDKTDGIRLNHTGPRGQAYQCAFPLIVAADKETGKCELSAPLAKALAAGRLELFTLKYQPFGGAVFEDGKPNPAAKDTLDGWMEYVAIVSRTAKAALGTEKAPDAGFDIEVWNEYTFGSQFLNDRNYYDPPRKYKEPISFTYHGKTKTGNEILLPMTIAYVNDPNNALPGVAVIDGFANQRPWESGTEMWFGQTGFSRHYYTGINPGAWEGTRGLLWPQGETLVHQVAIDALGKDDGKAGRKEKEKVVVPATYFIPTLAVNMPEFWHYGYKTEFMTRDIQPFPGPWDKHHRYSHPEGSAPAQVWMTEFNIDRGPWASHLIKQTGCDKKDPRLIELMHHMAAKATLRTFVFCSHKGVHTINMFAARDGDTSLGVIPEAFYKTLADANYQLTDQVRRHTGPQLTLLRRVTEMMRRGEVIQTPRPLKVAKLVEHKPRLVFKGDGTPAHPDRFNRDDFTCLPFQLGPGKFAVAYYVVTRDIIHVWNKEFDVLDGRRYDMPDQTFDLDLANVKGLGARNSVWDPMTGQTTPVGGLGFHSQVSVSLPTSDYPRFLIIEEAAPGPLILEPRLTGAGRDEAPGGESNLPSSSPAKVGLVPASAGTRSSLRGGAELTFSTNIPVRGKVTWGALPDRTDGGSADLTPGKEHKVNIPTLADGAGAQITVEANGLSARWPLWGWDVEGTVKR